MSNLSSEYLVRKLRIKLSSGLLCDSSRLASGASGLEWGLTSPTLPQEPDEPGASPGPLQEIADVLTYLHETFRINEFSQTRFNLSKHDISRLIDHEMQSM